MEWKALNQAAAYFEGNYNQQSDQVTPASDYALPTSVANAETTFTYFESQSEPLTSSNTKLRNYSPFTIRVMPPLLYLDNPELLTGGEIGRVNMGIYDSALSNNSNFSSFTGAVSSYGQSGGAQSFSRANNSNFGSPTAYSAGGRSTTRSSFSTTDEDMVESAITDFDIAESMAQQLDSIMSAPPLTFYINPSSFSITYTKKHQFTERTRYGYIYQAWGEDQPKIAISGRVGSFVAGRGRSPTAVPTGHQFGSKLDSVAFQQLMALLTLYKNNGYIYDLIGRSNAHQLVGCLAIEYDGFTYFGHMESFEWGYEQDQHAGGINYSFNFTVSRMYDTKQESTLTVSPQDSTNAQMKKPNSSSVDSFTANRLQESQNQTQLKPLPRTNSTDYRARSKSKSSDNATSLPQSQTIQTTSQDSSQNEGQKITIQEPVSEETYLSKNVVFNNTYGVG